MTVTTITDHYRALNQKLHETNQNYGNSGFMRMSDVSDLVGSGDTVLDYGCGKGTLKEFAAFEVAEYDPAIPGKDADPEPADVVVCTDVMEHVEPELVDKVISHVYALTRRVAYFVISLRPANKTLPDGRNAHLSVHEPAWWRERMQAYFSFGRFEVQGQASDELVIVAYPIRELKEIPAKGAIDDEVRGQQMASCLARNLPRVQLHSVKGGEAALVCYGPSLNYMWPEIKLMQERGVHIITCSGAHDFLLARQVIPYAHTDIDGREHKARLVATPHPAVRYWLASVCHPTYFDRLRNYDVSWFHIQNSDATVKWVRQNDPEGWLLTGGLTVGNRAMGLLHHMGYDKIHVFGMDCSYGPSGRHAGPHTGKEQKKMEVRVGGRWFESSAQMICAARNIIESLEHIQAVSDVTFHGDGMLQWMIREAMGLNRPAKVA